MPFYYAAAVLAVGSIYSSQKAAKETRKGNKQRARTDAITNRNNRLQALGESRRIRAEQLSGAEGSQTASGTGVAQAVGSSQSQTFNSIGINNAIMDSKKITLGFMNKANQYSANAQSFATASSAASSLGGAFGKPSGKTETAKSDKA